MKKFLCIVTLALFLCVSLTGFAQAEQPQQYDEVDEPHIVYTRYTAEELYGLVDVPNDGHPYFVRVVFVLPCNAFFALVMPIQDGEFRVWTCCDAEYVSLQIVDKWNAYLPGSYIDYEAMGFCGLNAREHTPDRR